MLRAFMGSVTGKVAAGVLLVGITSAVGYHTYTILKERGRTAAAIKERNELHTWIGNTCASVGSPPTEDPAVYRTVCAEVIRRLYKFHENATSETNKALVRAEQDRVHRLEVDNAARIKRERNLQEQVRLLKEVSRNVQDDQVGPDYWAALNRVGGLSPSTAGDPATSTGGEADSGGHLDAASAAGGTADLPPTS